MRQRWLAALLVCGVTALAASAPGLYAASDDLAQAQRLVDLAQLDVQAVSLAHSLADERDGMAWFIARGRTAKAATDAGLTKAQLSRVDGQVRELTDQARSLDPAANGDAAGVAAALSGATGKLRELPRIRRAALSGGSDAQAAVTGYSQVIDALGGIGAALARALPSRAASADAGALPDLSRAVDQASVQRALLVAALAEGGPQSGTVEAARTAALRERAALADFHAAASPRASDQYDETVTGSDVADAERDLARLTDSSSLSATEQQRYSASKVQSALSLRIDLMRGVESSLVAADATRIAAVRDADVTALELRVALAAACLLLVAGTVIRTGRSVTRPLGALDRFARGKADEAKVIGDDEFATVARRLNALAAEVAQQRALATAPKEPTEPKEPKEAPLTASAASGAHDQAYVDLTLRTLGLVERQLTHLEQLEEAVQDPDELSRLYTLDHLATRMRRNGENLLLLAGHETRDHGERDHGERDYGARAGDEPEAEGPGRVPVVDVARAAVSETERYERTRIGAMPDADIAGPVADDLSHLLAELLENAERFSPPEAEVRLSGLLTPAGEVVFRVEDEGAGIPGDLLARLNDVLAHPGAAAPGDGTVGLGLYVVARLAERHGLRIRLSARRGGGVAAAAVVPAVAVTPAERSAASAAAKKATAPPNEATAPAVVALPGPRVPLDEAPAEGAAHDDRPVTARGLPRRVPREAGLPGDPGDPGPAAGPVDPEALRRKLGGLAQGLNEGRRDAAQEQRHQAPEYDELALAGAVAGPGPHETTGAEGDGESRGENVEEARG